MVSYLTAKSSIYKLPKNIKFLYQPNIMITNIFKIAMSCKIITIHLMNYIFCFSENENAHTVRSNLGFLMILQHVIITRQQH